MSWYPLFLSFQVTGVGVALATVFGLAVAVLLSKRWRGRDLLDGLVTMPLVVPPTVLGYYVLVTLGRNTAIGSAWESLTGSSIVFTRTGAIVAAAIGAFPLIVKAARAALEGVDAAFVGAARTMGASALRAFFTVELPLAARGIVAGVMLGFARSLGDFGVTLMVAGDIPGETQTASLAIYDAIQANREDDALGMIVVLSAFAILVLYSANKLTGRRADAI